SGCSATTTRCPTSASSPRESKGHWRSSSRSRAPNPPRRRCRVPARTRPPSKRSSMLSRSSLAAALSVVAALVVAAPAFGAPASPRIIGGPVVPITVAPWQVYLVIDNTTACGGSILDATHVLTAAHCADGGGTHAVVAPSSIKVLAGWSDVSTYSPGGTPPAGTQVVDGASLRLQPYSHPQF